MSDELLTGIYLVGAIWGFRKGAGWVFDDFKDRSGDTFFLAGMTGTICGTIWPVVATGLLIHSAFAHADKDTLAWIMSGKPSRRERQKRQRDRLQKEIDQLDRELGLVE